MLGCYWLIIVDMIWTYISLANHRIFHILLVSLGYYMQDFHIAFLLTLVNIVITEF